MNEDAAAAVVVMTFLFNSSTTMNSFELQHVGHLDLDV